MHNYNQIKSVLQTLNWLPVEQKKIVFKTDLLVFKTFQSGQPLRYTAGDLCITQNFLIQLDFLIY